MELFERIKQIMALKGLRQDAFASAIGINVNTFHGYLNKKRQNKLMKLLPKILDVFPDLARDWLYFGEGDMLAANNKTKADLVAENIELIEELRATNKVNRQLTAQLLDAGRCSGPQFDRTACQ